MHYVARSVHDCSDGGMLVSLAEMAMASGLGVEIEGDYAFGRGAAFFFGEDQASYVIESDPESFEDVIDRARAAGVELFHLGFVRGDSINLMDPGRHGGAGFKVKIADLRAAHAGFFPRLMGADAALA